MGSHPLPELSPVVISLIRAGVYSLYEYTDVAQPDVCFLLVTNAGRVHLLSDAGRVLASPADTRLTDYSFGAPVQSPGRESADIITKLNVR